MNESRDGNSAPDFVSEDGKEGYAFSDLDQVRQFLENDRLRQISDALARDDHDEANRLVELGSFLK